MSEAVSMLVPPTPIPHAAVSYRPSSSAAARKCHGAYWIPSMIRNRSRSGCLLLGRSLVILALVAPPAAAADQPQHVKTQHVKTQGNQSPASIAPGGKIAVSYGYTAEQLALIIAAATGK